MEKTNFKTKYNKVPVTKEPEEASDIKKKVEAKPEPEKKIEWSTAKVVNCQNLNLRKEPSTEAAVIKTIKVGTEVQLDSSFVSSEWSHIKYFGDTGYVMSRYLER